MFSEAIDKVNDGVRGGHFGKLTLAGNEFLCGDVEEAMSSSAVVGDGMQVDAIQGASCIGVARMMIVEGLDICSTHELAMLGGVDNWKSQDGSGAVNVGNSIGHREVVELGCCLLNQSDDKLFGEAFPTLSMIETSDAFLEGTVVPFGVGLVCLRASWFKSDLVVVLKSL